MASQYIPSQYIQSFIFGVFALYVLAKFPNDSLGKKILIPVVLVLLSVGKFFKKRQKLIENKGASDYLLLPARVSNILVAFAIVVFAAVATKKDVTVGKTKIL
jgi:hypothetical protein